MYVESVSFIESFCKTLEESYDQEAVASHVFDCKFSDIQAIINIFDSKYSSPEIKTLTRFLVSLVFFRPPLALSENIQIKTLDTVWNNCSEAKPYFYQLMGALLVNKESCEWLKSDDHSKTKDLVEKIIKSIESNSVKILAYQMYLLMIISAHESDFLRVNKIHLDLYNRMKVLVYEDS